MPLVNPAKKGPPSARMSGSELRRQRRTVLRRILRNQDVDPADRDEAKQLVRVQLRLNHPALWISGLILWTTFAVLNAVTHHWDGVITFGVLCAMSVVLLLYGRRLRQWRRTYLPE